MKLEDKASATKDPVEREMLEHFLTVECLMYNRGTSEQDLTTLFARYPLFTGGYEHVGHLVYYNDAPNDLYPETYTSGEGTPDWMYRVPPFRMLDPGDHMMDRYIKHAKTWAKAAKAGAADVE